MNADVGFCTVMQSAAAAPSSNSYRNIAQHEIAKDEAKSRSEVHALEQRRDLSDLRRLADTIVSASFEAAEHALKRRAVGLASATSLEELARRFAARCIDAALDEPKGGGGAKGRRVTRVRFGEDSGSGASQQRPSRRRAPEEGQEVAGDEQPQDEEQGEQGEQATPPEPLAGGAAQPGVRELRG
eukprot:384566-Prymnesium_polylepis.1